MQTPEWIRLPSELAYDFLSEFDRYDYIPGNPYQALAQLIKDRDAVIPACAGMSRSP